MVSGPQIRLNKTGVLCIVLVILYILYLTLFRQQNNGNVNVDLKKLLIGSIEVAIEGGQKVLNVYNSENLHVRSKGGLTPVTDADISSHCLMFFALKRTFPGVSVISEEHSTSADCGSSFYPTLDQVLLGSSELPSTFVEARDVTIWIDPLDATQEFTEKLVEYVTTMVCVAVKGIPTLGIIHFPFAKTTTWAWKDHATSVTWSKNPASELKIITSRSHKGDVLAVLKKAMGENVAVIHAGGAGFKAVQVANGNVSAYVHTTHINKWDICAGDAVLRALGGKMTTLKGEDIRYDADSNVANDGGLLATLKDHAKLLDMLSRTLTT